MNSQTLELLGQNSQQQYEKLTAKLLKNEYIEPYLGSILFPYYSHYCVISVLGINYSHYQFGFFDNGCRSDRYDRIGMLLKRI
ncbi:MULTISPECIES: hypothetical protein [unclassified Microcoleus]|uniref:hypothetical protein n=1 Tax=unclassified Microcoleus TaxID=2642155 RepID=UPI002FD0A9FD